MIKRQNIYILILLIFGLMQVSLFATSSEDENNDDLSFSFSIKRKITSAPDRENISPSLINEEEKEELVLALNQLPDIEDIENIVQEPNLQFNTVVPRLDELQLEVLRNNLQSFLEKYIIDNETIQEKRLAKYGRRSLKILATLFGVTAGVPFINAACEAGYSVPILQHTPIMCTAFAIGTVVAYGGASTWAGLKLVGRLDAISEEEKEIKTLETHSKYNSLKHITANALGFISCIPDMYSVYKYNNLKLLVLPAFVVDYFFKTEGYYEFMHDISLLATLSNHKQGESDKINNIITENFLPTIYNQLKTNTLTPDEVKLEAELFLRHIPLGEPQASEITQETSFYTHGKDLKMLRKIIQGISIACPVGNAIVNGLLAYDALGLIIEPSFICAPAAVIITIPGFSLDVFASTHTAGLIFDAIYAKISGRSHEDFVNIFFPKLSKVIPFSAYVLALLSATGDAYVAYDTANNSIFSSLKYILPFMVVGANSVFEGYTSTILFKNIILEGCELFGSTITKTAAMITTKFQTITSMISSYFTHVPVITEDA